MYKAIFVEKDENIIHFIPPSLFDIELEIIIKKLMYDKDNLKSLYNSLSKLQLHPDLYLRTLVGNYTKEHEIHKRPMSKFMQDIARDLGIID